MDKNEQINVLIRKRLIRDGQVTSMKYLERIIIKVLYSILCLLFLIGCTRYNPDINDFDNTGFYANLKGSTLSPIGKKAAYYEGRIYYLSSELGRQGIYSMDTSGKDIRLEISVEDIRSINVRDDGIYYAGFAGIKKNPSGTFRQFRLLIQKTGETKTVDYLKDVDYACDWPVADGNVWDFYISNHGVVVICFAEVNHHMKVQIREVASFLNGHVVPRTDYTIVNEGTAVNYEGLNQSTLAVGQLNGISLISDSFSMTDSPTKEFLTFCLSVLDQNTRNDVVKMMTGSYLGYNDDDADYLRWFCRGNSDGFILASVHGLEKYDLATNTVSDIVTFDQPENVYAQIDCGDNFLVFTELLRKTYDLDYHYYRELKQTRALAESLYRVDPEIGAKQLLLAIEKENAFLYADAETTVTGGGKTISIYDISGDKAVLLRTIAIEHNILGYSNKVDTAGGWLFLYRFNEQTQRDELIEKVYIGS